MLHCYIYIYSDISFIKRHVIIYKMCKKECNKKYRNMILLPQNQHNDPVYPKQNKNNKKQTWHLKYDLMTFL